MKYRLICLDVKESPDSYLDFETREQAEQKLEEVKAIHKKYSGEDHMPFTFEIREINIE